MENYFEGGKGGVSCRGGGDSFRGRLQRLGRCERHTGLYAPKFTQIRVRVQVQVQEQLLLMEGRFEKVPSMQREDSESTEQRLAAMECLHNRSEEQYSS